MMTSEERAVMDALVHFIAKLCLELSNDSLYRKFLNIQRTQNCLLADDDYRANQLKHQR